jgi:glycosyltransferase involved in cell wall biosynthesis
MRVLFVTQWFPPEPWRVHLEAAMAFKDLGHEVEVVTGFPNWPQGKIYPGYKLKLIQREVIEGLPVTRIPLYPNHDPNGFKRILNLVSLSIALLCLGPLVLKKADHIHVVQIPFLVLASGWVALLWRAKVSMEVQDLWLDTLVFAGGVREGTGLRLISWICNRAYSLCCRVRVISQGFEHALIERGVPEEKIRVIPNWIDPNVLKPLPADDHMLNKLGVRSSFRVVYAGAIGVPQKLAVVIGAAEILRNDPRICFVMVGDGVEREMLQAMAKEKALSNVVFAGSFPQTEMSRVYSIASALLIHLADSPLYAITVPSKINSCLSAGKPVLAGLQGYGKEIIEKGGAGVAFQPESANALADAVLALAARTDAEREAMGKRGRQLAETELSASAIAPKMSEMFA